jgi:hypothetical protein
MMTLQPRTVTRRTFLATTAAQPHFRGLVIVGKDLLEL